MSVYLLSFQNDGGSVGSKLCPADIALLLYSLDAPVNLTTGKEMGCFACWILLRFVRVLLKNCAKTGVLCRVSYTISFSLCCICLPMASSFQRKYQYNLRDALEVKDNRTPWTVIVQVLIKYPTKPSRKDPNLLFKKFLLTDMKGTAISAITFQAIEHFDRIFEPFKRYYVTSAAVREIDPRFKIGEYNYSWTLYPRTHVQPINDPVPHLSPYSFDYMKYSDMFKVANRSDSIEVKGMIVHAIPVAHKTRPFVRDYVIVDEEERPMILRVWEDVLNEDVSGVTVKLPTPTFISAVDLKVTVYNGLSLSTGFDAHFMVDPPLRAKETLLSWYNEHTERIGQLIQEEAYKSPDILLPLPSQADIVPIKSVLSSMQNLKSAWVSGKVHLVPAQNKMWHAACDKCKKTVNLPIGSNFPCAHCGEDMNVEPRCHVQVWVNDPSGTLSATLFASLAEKFIGYTAMELTEATDKNTQLEDEIARNINKKSVACFLKDYDRSFEGRYERSFPVVHLYVLPEADSAENDEDCSLVVDAATPNIQVSALVPDETEKQPFSLATKGVVDEMAIKIGLDQGTLPSSATAKRAIVFGESSEASEAVLVCEKLSSSAAENIVTRSGSESPIKKPKNAAAGKCVD